MLAKPFYRSVVLLLVLTLAVLAPASAAAAGPRDPSARQERAADLPRPVTGFWGLVFVVVERAAAVFAASMTGSPGGTVPTSGATLDPSGHS